MESKKNRKSQYRCRLYTLFSVKIQNISQVLGFKLLNESIEKVNFNFTLKKKISKKTLSLLLFRKTQLRT